MKEKNNIEDLLYTIAASRSYVQADLFLSQLLSESLKNDVPKSASEQIGHIILPQDSDNSSNIYNAENLNKTTLYKRIEKRVVDFLLSEKDAAPNEQSYNQKSQQLQSVIMDNFLLALIDKKINENKIKKSEK
jgi:hypothetical protein